MLLPVIRLQPLRFKLHLRALRSVSQFSSTPHPGPSNDTVFTASALLRKPDWQKNGYLKSLVSYLNPLLVSRIVAFHSGDIPLCLNFFKWACKESTYCYDIDSRIQLLYLLVSYNLYGVVHKVLVFLIKECSSSQVDILKLMDAIGDIREEDGFRINYPCYSMLLMCLAKLDMGFMAFLVFKRMVEDGFVVTEIDYRTVINALCKNGFVQAAEMFFSRVLKLGYPLDVYIYASLVLGNCRAGELSNAFRVFALMSEQDGCGFNSATYSVLIHGLCEVGRLDEACKLKEEMSEKGCQPSTRTYTVLIKAMCDKGLTSQAFSLLDEMIKEGCKPNVHTYTVLVDMLCRDGRIEEANGIFRKMLEDGVNPGTATYNALINGYCKEGRVVSAFELLGVMERRHCKPNIRTYNELMEGLCKSGRPYKAVALLRKVINSGIFPTEVTFNILIDGLCRAGHLNMALKILHYMSSIGIEPDQVSYTPFIDRLCKIEKLEQAGVFLGLMMKKGISLDEVTLTALIHGYCKTGNTRSAFMLFEEMIEDRCLTSPHIFNIFLDVLGKEVKLVAENAMLGKLLKYGLVPSVVTYTILVDKLSRAGDTNSPLKMLELMKQAGCPPNVYTYTVVIRGLCWNGELENAENLMIEMQKNAVFPNDTIYALLVKSYVAAGRLYCAVDVVSTMLQNGCQPSTQIYIALLAGIMTLEMTNSDSSRACMAALNPKSLSSVEAHNCLPNFIFKEVDIYHAFQLLDIIRDSGGHPFDAYKFLIIGLCRTGRISETDILIQEMLKFGLTPDSDICASIVSHFCKMDNYNHCLDWILRFRACGCVLSFASYSTAIVGLQKEGRLKEVEWLISDLLGDSGNEDQTVISPYISFLIKGQVPYQSSELLNIIEQMGNKERPIV